MKLGAGTSVLGAIAVLIMAGSVSAVSYALTLDASTEVRWWGLGLAGILAATTTLTGAAIGHHVTVQAQVVRTDIQESRDEVGNLAEAVFMLVEYVTKQRVTSSGQAAGLLSAQLRHPSRRPLDGR